MFYEKRVLQNVFNIYKKTPVLESLFLACNFIKKEALAQVSSCKFCEISKNTLPYRTLPVAASVISRTAKFPVYSLRLRKY